MLMPPNFSEHIVSRVYNNACHFLTVDSHFFLHSITTLSKTSLSFHSHSLINTVLPTYLILLHERLMNKTFYSFFWIPKKVELLIEQPLHSLSRDRMAKDINKKKSTPVSLPCLNLKGFRRSEIHTLGRYSKAIQISGYISF